MARIWRRKSALSLPMFIAQSSTIPGIGSWKNSPNRLSLSSFRFWKEKNKRQARDAQSALGHKRTFALHQTMSALPPKADICSALRYVRFGPIADSCTAAKKILFDHLVSAGEQGRWNDNTKGPCDLKIDDQFERGRARDRQVAGFLTFQYAAGVDTSLPISVQKT